MTALDRLRYDSIATKKIEVCSMKIRWMILFFPVVSVVVLSLLVQNHAARAAAPQGALAAASVANAAAAAPGPLTIPDTTLAINSDKPMSQRVVHYEIDAKYDATKHTVDATEVLTYHNLTGQALDHFPFHLYQNAFQPNATLVREAKVDGSRDTGYEKWEDKYYGSEDIKSIEVVGQGDLTSQLAIHSARRRQQRRQDSSRRAAGRSRSRRAITCSSRSHFRPSFPRPRRGRDGSAISCWAGSGFRKSASGGTAPGTATSITHTTEFFADFGVYDVKLTVPQNEVVGASGVKVERSEQFRQHENRDLSRRRHSRLRLDRQPALQSQRRRRIQGRWARFNCAS